MRHGFPLQSADRAGWQIRLRWWVPPAIVAAVLGAARAGFELPIGPMLAIAAAILLYNLALLALWRRVPEADRALAVTQVGLDYAAMVLLIQFSGGTASPLLWLFVLHVIFAAMLFRPALAYAFAAAAVTSAALLAAADLGGLWPARTIGLRGTTLFDPGPSGRQAPVLLAFGATTGIVAALSTALMARLRRQMVGLEEAKDRTAALNEKLHSLYAIAGIIGRERAVGPALQLVADELGTVLEAPAVTVMLLARDRRSLRLAAARALEIDSLALGSVPVAGNAPVERLLAGEAWVAGRTSEVEPAMLRERLARPDTPALLYAPLEIERETIGILGLYGDETLLAGLDRDFVRLAAELAALAIENARAHEATERLMVERTRFMLQVTHNLRAPINAALSMLEVITGGYAGDVAPPQRAYLERIRARLKRLSETIGELLAIAQTRAQGRELTPVPVAPRSLAEDIERTFRASAVAHSVSLTVTCAADAPTVRGDPDLLQQMLENLVSNAIKYTPAGGSVEVRFARAQDAGLRIEVRDTGIGIPKSEQPALFTEFFRASNARQLEEVGTGLGLSIVKQTVEQHGGRLEIRSGAGQGTAVTVHLPV